MKSLAQLKPGDLDVLQQLVQLQTGLKLDAEAADTYEEIAARDPKDVKSLQWLVKYHQNRQSWSDAARTLRRLADRQPKDTAPLLQLAEALKKMNQPDEAANVYREVLERDPKDKTARQALDAIEDDKRREAEKSRINEITEMFNRAAALEKAGKLAEAIGVYDQILNIQPDNGKALEARQRVRLDMIRKQIK